jgi:hypothetical protein
MFRLFRGLTAASLILSGLLVPASAQAQTRSGDASSDEAQLEVELLGFPISVSPADALTVSLEVTNGGAAAANDLEVGLTIYRGVLSRFELAQTYEGRLGRVVASDTIKVEGTIDPGQKRTIEVSKPLSELDAFRDSTTDRAHPVRVVVRSGDIASEPVDTHMVFFSQPPEKPLGIGMVIPLHSKSMYTDAARPGVVTSDGLEKSVTSGRLDSTLRALEEYPNLPVTLAPSGMLISMLQDMSDGYPRRSKNGTTNVSREDPRALAATRALASIRTLITRPNTRLIATTYSPTSLPALNRFGLDDLVNSQLTEGRNILKSEPVGLLGGQAMPGWLLPANGDLDDASLAELQHTESNRLILSSRSLRQQSGSLTRGLPVKLEGGGRTATDGLAGVETIALVGDPGLNSHIENANELGVVEARQRFAAETATIHLETPGLIRAVVALAPLEWEVEPGSVAGILSTLSFAPWLVATTPDNIAAQLSPPANQEVRLATSETLLESFKQVPASSYFTALEDAQNAIDRYAELAPPPEQLGALSRRLLIAESADWWSSRTLLARGLAFARAVPVSVSSEIKMIRAPAPQTITLTSRTGVIPLSVGSALKYPVDVVIRLDSDKLRFPDGNRIDVNRLKPPNQTFRVRAITQASGTFPLTVQVLTPSGRLVSDSQLTIRSTAYNVVALSITGGAGVFLVGWWAIGAVRRRLPLA